MLRFVIIILTLLLSYATLACDCSGGGAITTEDYNETDAIFIGKFEKEIPGVNSMVLDKFTVTKWYKGDTGRTTVYIHTNYGVSYCGLGRLKPGNLYLVYANKTDNKLFASRCGRTAYAHTPEQKSDKINSKYDHGYLRNYFSSDTQFLNKIMPLIKKGGYQKIYYPDGKIMSEGSFTNGRAEGYWKYYNTHGQVSEKGNYKNGLKDSIWAEYEITSIEENKYGLNRLIEFKDGVRTLWEINYHGDYPKKYSETYPQKGTDKWIHKVYHNNGNLRVMITYDRAYVDKYGRRRHGHLDGPNKSYHENGRLEEEGEYYKNVETGVWKEYDSNGKLIKTRQEKTKAEIDAQKEE